MITNETETRQKLAKVEALIATVTDQLNQLEGQRDSLLRQLQDCQGAADSRFTIR